MKARLRLPPLKANTGTAGKKKKKRSLHKGLMLPSNHIFSESDSNTIFLIHLVIANPRAFQMQNSVFRHVQCYTKAKKKCIPLLFSLSRQIKQHRSKRSQAEKLDAVQYRPGAEVKRCHGEERTLPQRQNKYCFFTIVSPWVFRRGALALCMFR